MNLHIQALKNRVDDDSIGARNFTEYTQSRAFFCSDEIWVKFIDEIAAEKLARILGRGRNLVRCVEVEMVMMMGVCFAVLCCSVSSAYTNVSICGLVLNRRICRHTHGYGFSFLSFFFLNSNKYLFFLVLLFFLFLFWQM